MILYKKDWEMYPTAIIDYETKNTSFVRYAGLLKKMGVENNAFCLALVNPNLVGVNPHSKTLNMGQILMIVEEIKNNPWYFFREVLRIPATATPDNLVFKANRGNISLYWLFFNHITSLLIQPRQTGKSVSTDGLMILLFDVLTLNTDFNLLTKDDNLRVKNVKRLKDILESLPAYLNLKSKSDVNNTEKLTLKKLGNTYHTSVGQASPKAALNLGRGMTIAINHVDEIAFIRNIKYTLPALLAAAGAARDAAAAAGAPYGNIFTTTAGYLSSESGEFAYKIYKDCLRWSEKLYDCDDEQGLKDIISKNNPTGKLQILLEFNHRQLGFTDEWLRGKIADAMSEGEDAGADFLNKWAEGNESSPIDKEYLKIISNSIVNDPYTEITKYGYIVRWYVPEWEVLEKLPNRKLVASLDSSDAVGNDDIAMVIRDSVTAEVVGAGVYNETNLITYSDWLADFICDYPNITFVIERRSSGVGIIDNLLKLLPMRGVDPFRRLFNWVTNDVDIKPEYRKEVLDIPITRRDPMVYVKYRKEFGYATSGTGRASRDNLYGTSFNSSIKYTSGSVRDKTLEHQLNQLIKKNGRIDHKANEHDDTVIAWLLGFWFLSQGKNKSYYGLNNQLVLSTINNAIIDEQGGKEAIIAKRKQFIIKQNIENIISVIEHTTDPVMVMLHTNKIKHLYKQLEDDVSSSFNIEALLERIKMKNTKKSYAS